MEVAEKASEDAKWQKKPDAPGRLRAFQTTAIAFAKLVSWEDLDLKPGRASGKSAAPTPALLTEKRAISLRQLQQFKPHISRRCTSEKWNSTFNGKPLTPSAVSLYDLAKYCIRPVTAALGCSYVELYADGEQLPNWFGALPASARTCHATPALL